MDMKIHENPIKIGVVAEKWVGNSLYIHEMITYEGLFSEKFKYKKLKRKLVKNLPPLLILTSNAPYNLSKWLQKKLRKYVEKGGGLFVFGLIKGIEDLTGNRFRMDNPFPFPIGGIKYRSLGEGYFSLNELELRNINQNPLWSGLDSDYFPLHAFGCVAAEAQDSQLIGQFVPNSSQVSFLVENDGDSGSEKLNNQPEKSPAITLKKIGQGFVVHFLVDLVKTIRMIQEGRFVDSDGTPPADGMAPIDDGILKCEDGLVLDWNKDRRLIDTEPFSVPVFLHPISDIWRIIMRKSISMLSTMCGITLSRVSYWPDGADFVLHISHDTDGNKEKQAIQMLKNLNKARERLPQELKYPLQTTFCLIPPGYSPSLCENIKKEGHELAFHFDAQSVLLDDIFSSDVLDDQMKETRERTGISSFFSNKNHYTRWEKKVAFFEWLERLGVKVDQSKGPSKCGTMGFPFGSAHPWLPMKGDSITGKFIKCYELSFQSQDPGLQGPLETWKPLMDAVKKVQGVSHFIYHPAHVDKDFVADAMQDMIQYAYKSGGIFMRCDDIIQWVEKRKKFIKNPENVEIPKFTKISESSIELK